MLEFKRVIHGLVDPFEVGTTAIGGAAAAVVLKIANPAVDLCSQKPVIALGLVTAHVAKALIMAHRNAKRQVVPKPDRNDI